MAAKKILFIEGEPNPLNGDLRQGFAKLLEKRVKGKLPRIILGDGKSHTVDKFKNNNLEAKAFLLLIDLDKPSTEREQDLEEYELSDYRANVFYMIQEMEGWFISQPSILDIFYGVVDKGKKVSEKLTKQKPEEISDPKGELKRATKNSKRGEYKEIKHAVELLKMLDAEKLGKDFLDFEELVKTLKE